MGRVPLTPEERRKRLKRRVIVYTSLVVILIGVYKFQPIEIDIFPRQAPAYVKVDPDSTVFLSSNSRVMIVTAHPDDSEFYIAGTMLKLKEAGATVNQLVMTNGDKAYYFWADNSGLTKTRQGEQTAASKSEGVKELRFAGFPDGRLRNNDETVAAVSKAIGDWHPTHILCFDGEYPPRSSHQDHRRSGDITLAAVKASNWHGWVMMFNGRGPNYVVDTESVIEPRLKALAFHKSQFYGAKLDKLTEFRRYAEIEEGEIADLGYGEAFRCVHY